MDSGSEHVLANKWGMMPRFHLQGLIRPLGFLFLLSFLMLISATRCFSADIVFICSSESSSWEHEKVDIAANFYGANVHVVTADAPGSGLAVREAIAREETSGVIIAADALSQVNRNAVMSALKRRTGKYVPLFIAGVTAQTDPALLKAWSGGAVLGGKSFDGPLHPQYAFGNVEGVTGQLSNVEIPFQSEEVAYLLIKNGAAVEPILSVRNGQQESPVFVEVVDQKQKIFVTSSIASDAISDDRRDVVNAFLRTVGVMMFTRYCAGEQGWHAIEHYANFTIDDPWLREPYGYVNYASLLTEMEKHHFHTTIAFIPWNYSRSEAAVVSLFRKHPDRFSIAIHGDNHDHKEFSDYQSKPLSVQVAALKQSLARMDKFRALTGIDYDHVMIFPHSIPPEKTLEALKTYNYLATVNSEKVPQDAKEPSSLLFDLRPVTLSFAGFPSISRYSIAGPITPGFLAVNEFLGNPLFFYGHSDDFAKGSNAFDAVADEVNKTEPDTQWRGLEEIVKHLYVVKLRPDSNYDVVAFSNSICLENKVQRDPVFYVRRPEIGGATIKSVLVDGQPYSNQVENGSLSLNVRIPANGSRCIAIEYENDLQLASISTSDYSPMAYALRKASDFRDIYLSKSTAGLALVHFYYDHKWTPTNLVEIALAFLAIGIFAAFRLLIRRRART